MSFENSPQAVIPSLRLSSEDFLSFEVRTWRIVWISYSTCSNWSWLWQFIETQQILCTSASSFLHSSFLISCSSSDKFMNDWDIGNSPIPSVTSGVWGSSWNLLELDATKRLITFNKCTKKPIKSSYTRGVHVDERMWGELIRLSTKTKQLPEKQKHFVKQSMWRVLLSPIERALFVLWELDRTSRSLLAAFCFKWQKGSFIDAISKNKNISSPQLAMPIQLKLGKSFAHKIMVLNREIDRHLTRRTPAVWQVARCNANGQPRYIISSFVSQLPRVISLFWVSDFW